MIENKIQRSLEIIDASMRNWKNPFILWSGGKDSMAMLHLIMFQFGKRLPVVFFREQWQPWKYEFQNDIIEKWGLEVYTWNPSESAFQQNGDEFEVQNLYFINNTPYTCPTGIVKPENGIPFVCALDIYNRPKQGCLNTCWDLGFVGHKKCDSDPIYGGDAGTRIEAMMNGHFISSSYPLRDWSHDDVFSYCEMFNVPIQTSRYEKVSGKWKERSSKENNCDYVHACTACLDSSESACKTVRCPKLGMMIENASKCVNWANKNIPQYMKD